MARQGLWRWRWRRWWYQSAPIFVPYSTTVTFFLQLTKKMCSLATMVIFLQITTEMWSFFFHHGDFCTNHQRNAFPFHFDDFFLLIANVMVSFLTRVVFLPTTEILSFFTTVVSVLISIEMQSHFIMMVSTKSWSDVDDDDFSTNHRRIALSFHHSDSKMSFLFTVFIFLLLTTQMTFPFTTIFYVSKCVPLVIKWTQNSNKIQRYEMQKSDILGSLKSE